MTEQERREKVIKGLECCGAYDYKCNVCPYQDDGGAEDGCCSDELKTNALALLKAQEPRVMTLEEAADAEICWIEVRSRRGVEPGKVRIYREDDYSAFINRLLPYVNENMPQHEYGEHWRCWNVRPDEKRRAETPWRL